MLLFFDLSPELIEQVREKAIFNQIGLAAYQKQN